MVLGNGRVRRRIMEKKTKGLLAAGAVGLGMVITGVVLLNKKPSGYQEIPEVPAGQAGVKGKVDVNGNALGNVLVSLVGFTVNRTTDANGAWYFNEISPLTTYVINFSKDGYQTTSITLQPLGEGLFEVDDVVMTESEAPIGIQSPALWGTVVDKNGQPLNGVSVLLVQDSLSYITSSDGKWVFSDLKTQYGYTAVFSKDGYITQSLTLWLDIAKILQVEQIILQENSIQPPPIITEHISMSGFDVAVPSYPITIPDLSLGSMQTIPFRITTPGVYGPNIWVRGFYFWLTLERATGDALSYRTAVMGDGVKSVFDITMAENYYNLGKSYVAGSYNATLSIIIIAAPPHENSFPTIQKTVSNFIIASAGNTFPPEELPVAPTISISISVPSSANILYANAGGQGVYYVNIPVGFQVISSGTAQISAIASFKITNSGWQENSYVIGPANGVLKAGTNSFGASMASSLDSSYGVPTPGIYDFALSIQVNAVSFGTIGSKTITGQIHLS
jgi:hypothetical protein